MLGKPEGVLLLTLSFSFPFEGFLLPKGSIFSLSASTVIDLVARAGLVLDTGTLVLVFVLLDWAYSPMAGFVLVLVDDDDDDDADAILMRLLGSGRDEEEPDPIELLEEVDDALVKVSFSSEKTLKLRMACNAVVLFDQSFMVNEMVNERYWNMQVDVQGAESALGRSG